MTQMHQGGQQPVNKHQPVSCTGAGRPPTRSIGQSCVLAGLPALPQFDDQLGQDPAGTAR